MPRARDLLSNVGLSIVGALLGCLLYHVILNKLGYYPPLLVFGLTGLGGGLMVRKRYWQLGCVSVIIGCIANLYVEVTNRPFIDHPSAWYYITHLHELDTIYLGPIPVFGWLFWVLGIGLCFWLGMGRPAVCTQAD